ncbi:unnamed protein product [Cuscuta campestris]|uniref:Retrovirus-related Pol polyprotein from transposon TNT 1-94-like beta-barrel domain-containing protein n=1 Tax=Cuscuta campestris TaxID=132261 RepID=A0A484L9T1_9ASTE|nr:unnamed protein product [Cuscuta campestris]
MSAALPLIPVFMGEGYKYWSIRMKTLLKSQDRWGFVKQGYTDPDDKVNRLQENGKKDAKALAIIQQAVHDNVFSRIALATTSKQAWSTLQKEFKGDPKVIVVKLQSLRRDFETLMMKNGESLANFFVKGNDNSQSNAILWREDEGQDHLRESTQKLDSKANCWSKEKQANYLREEEDENKLFMAVADAVDTPNDVWFVDSGFSNHMCSKKEMFKELDESHKIQVKLGDDKSIQVEGKGTVAIKNGHGNTKLIYDVYFIPKLAHNLLCWAIGYY